MLGLPGRQRLGLWRRGLAPPPPLRHLTGAAPTAFGSGTAEAAMPLSGWLTGSNGVIPGGVLAIVADIAFGVSVETELPAGVPYTTAELSLSFLRPARPAGRVIAGGQALHAGRSLGLSEVFLIDEERDRLIAHGTSRLTIFPPLDPLPEPPDGQAPVQLPSYETPDPYLRPAPDGTIPQEVWDELSGLEILRRQSRGDLPQPPIHHLTGIEPTAFSEGAATLRMPSSEWLNSPARRLQGGTIVLLADFAMLIAVQTTTEPGTALAGLDVKVNFLRPVKGDGRDLTARAEVVHRGRTLAITRAEVVNPEGKPVALATGSSMYLPGRPASLGEVELASGDDDGAADRA